MKFYTVTYSHKHMQVEALDFMEIEIKTVEYYYTVSFVSKVVKIPIYDQYSIY